MCVRFSSNLYHSQQITDSGTHTLTCLSWLCCVPHNFCLIVCTLDVRMAERQSMSPFSTNAAFSETMWPCVCHLPYLMFLSSFFHSSVTMTAGWEGWDTERAAQLEKKKKEKEKRRVWRADFMSSKSKRCMSRAVDAAALSDALRGGRKNYDSQLLKYVSHLNCSRPHASTIWTYTDICCCHLKHCPPLIVHCLALLSCVHFFFEYCVFEWRL